jgi:hypothetical protein
VVVASGLAGLRAQQAILSIGASTLQQYEPLLVCLRITNKTSSPLALEFSSKLRVERETAPNVWQIHTPWVGTNPWAFDIDVNEELARIKVADLAVGADYWHLWRPLLSPAALVPGSYRIKAVTVEVDEVVVAATAVLPFTVVAHPANAAAVAADLQKYERLMSRELSGGVDNGLVAVAQAWHANSTLSAGLRAWAGTELAEYLFVTRDYLGSIAISSQIVQAVFPLPCGGLGQCARFHVIRGNRMLSQSKAQFDARTVPLTQMMAQYPGFLSAYRYATYEARRRFLQ